MNHKYRVVRVILDIYHNNVDRTFDYLIPSHLQETIAVGMRVQVPFGKYNRMLEAFVMDVGTDDESSYKMKEVHGLLDDLPVLTGANLTVVQWMRNAYLCRAIEAIRCFVPNQRGKEKFVNVVELHVDTPRAIEKGLSFNKTPAQKRIIDYLTQYGSTGVSQLLSVTGSSRTSLQSLASKGIVVLNKRAHRRNPHQTPGMPSRPEPELTAQQKLALMEIRRTWQENPHQPILIHGITGSGKTEIYMQVIKQTLERNLDSILLVPEIALTPQMVDLFRGRFGDKIAVLHSHLSEGEKFDEWTRIRQGDANIIIGPRSAVFAPCKNLGTIIVDEEHENTYKSEQAPRYHAVDVARLRCQVEGGQLILGSATPSIERYHEALQGQHHLIQLTKRATGRNLPEVYCVDMREELRKGSKSLFSSVLVRQLEECLEQDHQAILFLNRRGYSTYITCHHCGHVVHCKRCDITMKWHKKENRLKCHYCSAEEALPEACPSCGQELAYQGAGTQRVEQDLALLLPGRVIFRMDQDTTRRKGAHQKILNQFSSGKIDVLIGTQMIAKGHDFPNVTLVGILLADTSLNLPDFRASEKTFQLITQVAGRSGRGGTEGKVILQTYQPNHYAVVAAAHQNYERFYQEEIKVRHTFDYPPYTRMIQLVFSGKSEQSVGETADRIAQGTVYMLNELKVPNTDQIVMMPGPAMISKAEDRYRHTLVLKTAGVSFALLKKIIRFLLIDKKQLYIPKNVAVTIDFDPQFVQ